MSVPGRSWRLWLVAGCGSLVLAAALAAMTATPTLAQDEPDPVTIYDEQCAVCHGVDARGGAGPSLLDSRLTLTEQAEITTTGGDGMPAYGDLLTPEEIEAVLAYALTLGNAGQGVPEDRLAADLFAESCAGCHGDDASGGEGGPSLLNTSAELEELVAVIAEGRGTMPAFAETYTTSEIAALAMFITRATTRVLPAEPVAAGAVLYAESCAGCHGADASGASATSLLQTSMLTEELRTVIAEGRGVMPAFDALGESNVESIVVYLEAVVASAEGSGAASTTTTTEPAVEETVPSTVAETTTSTTTATTTTTTTTVAAIADETPLLAGQRVFTGNCARCHGNVGEGGIAAPLRGTSLTVNEIIARVYGGHPEGMPAFDPELQAAEIQEVALFVLTLPTGGDDARGGVSLGAVGAALAATGAAIVAWWWRSRRRARVAS